MVLNKLIFTFCLIKGGNYLDHVLSVAFIMQSSNFSKFMEYCQVTLVNGDITVFTNLKSSLKEIYPLNSLLWSGVNNANEFINHSIFYPFFL